MSKMNFRLSLLFLIVSLGTIAQSGKVYYEGQIESELNPNLAALEQRKKDWQAILLDKEAAKKAVEAYFFHKNKAYENLDEGELDLAYAKLKEAKELMGRAHTKFVAYYAKQGRQDMINVYGGEFTDAIKSYEQALSADAIENDRAMCKPITELYLVKPENKVNTDNIDPENNDEDFWVVGDLEELTGNLIVNVNGKEFDLNDFEYQFYSELYLREHPIKENYFFLKNTSFVYFVKKGKEVDKNIDDDYQLFEGESLTNLTDNLVKQIEQLSDQTVIELYSGGGGGSPRWSKEVAQILKDNNLGMEYDLSFRNLIISGHKRYDGDRYYSGYGFYEDELRYSDGDRLKEYIKEGQRTSTGESYSDLYKVYLIIKEDKRLEQIKKAVIDITRSCTYNNILWKDMSEAEILKDIEENFYTEMAISIYSTFYFTTL